MFRFVRLEYIPCYSQAQLVDEFSKCTQREENNQFVEALAFSKETAVLMIGNMVTSAEPEKVKNTICKMMKIYNGIELTYYVCYYF